MRDGEGPLDDDIPGPGGFFARAYPGPALSRRRSGVARTLNDRELADWVALLAQQHPPDRLNRFRARAGTLAPRFGRADRIDLLDDLQSDLPDEVPSELPVIMTGRLREQPFFEAYLSNFIEGTESSPTKQSVSCTRALYHSHAPRRHDVTSTYELIVDAIGARTIPIDGDDLIETLRQNHQRLMAARPALHPGRFKNVPNHVGSYSFVQPEACRADPTTWVRAARCARSSPCPSDLRHVPH